MHMDSLPSLPSNRKFGAVFTVFFLALSFYLYFLGLTTVSVLSLIFASVFALVSWLSPSRLLPFNIIWMRLGFLIGAITTPIFLGFVFFVLITPVAQLAKIVGRDELKISTRQRDTYWTQRQNTGTNLNETF